MRLVFAGLLVFSACKSDTSMNPVAGGGDGGPTIDAFRQGTIDAPGGGGDGGSGSGTSLLPGRVCLANDPRQLLTAVSPGACATTGAGGLLVYLSGNTATTNADGTFVINTAGTTGLGAGTWRVSGANIVTSYMVEGDSEIPAISTTTYAAMRTANNVAAGYGEAAVMAILVHDGFGAAGYTVATSPAGDYLGFYDGTSTTTWTRTATGQYGTAWLPNIDIGNQTVSVKVFSGASNPATVSAPIFDQSITFVPIVL